MPIRALWAAAWNSASRMSGRRRYKSTGTPMAISAGGVGIRPGPSSRSVSSSGARPSNTLRASLDWRIPVSNSGIKDSVSRSRARACVTSSSLTAPY